MAYELWSLDTRNIVGDYESEEAALVAVSDALRAHGREAVIDLALAHEDRGGRTRLIAKGNDLVARAQAAATPADDAKLDKLIRKDTPTGLIDHELGRTEGAVRSHASETDRPLKPANPSSSN